MALSSKAVEATDVAARIDTTGGKAAGAQSLALRNIGGATVYLGGADVTVENGLPVEAGTWGPGLEGVDIAEGLFAVCAEGETTELRLLEQGV